MKYVVAFVLSLSFLSSASLVRASEDRSICGKPVAVNRIDWSREIAQEIKKDEKAKSEAHSAK
jgi:hypothetical protein